MKMIHFNVCFFFFFLSLFFNWDAYLRNGISPTPEFSLSVPQFHISSPQFLFSSPQFSPSSLIVSLSFVLNSFSPLCNSLSSLLNSLSPLFNSLSFPQVVLPSLQISFSLLRSYFSPWLSLLAVQNFMRVSTLPHSKNNISLFILPAKYQF